METNDPVHGSAREAAWRGRLSEEQARQVESRLAAHPEERRVWEEEVALTRLLTRLPDAAAPTNLTARILQSIDERAPASQDLADHSVLGWLRKLGWVPRLVGVAMLVAAVSLGFHQHRLASERTELARSVAEVSELTSSMPSIEVLQDFTAIRNLESAAVPDEELLALLQ